MRKFFLGFAALPLLALLATSCGKEAIESKGDYEKVLAFKATTGKQTLSKASEVTLADLQAEELTVYSYKDNDGNPYRTFTLNYIGGEWTYGPEVFHPIKFGLNHYSVYSAKGLADYQGGLTFEYTVGQDTDDTDGIDDDAAEQEDLMVASVTTTHADQPSATAMLVYKHILSQVNFAIQGKKGLIIEISDIKINNVLNRGTFTFGPIGDGGTWTLASNRTNYVYESWDGNSTTPGLNDGEILYLGNTGENNVVTPVNSRNNALMLMPQSFAGTSAGFSFHYRLTNKADDTFVDEDDFAVNFNDLSTNHKWEQGKRYLYILAFDPVRIKFNVVSVEGWIDDIDSPITVE